MHSPPFSLLALLLNIFQGTLSNPASFAPESTRHKCAWCGKAGAGAARGKGNDDAIRQSCIPSWLVRNISLSPSFATWPLPPLSTPTTPAPARPWAHGLRSTKTRTVTKSRPASLRRIRSRNSGSAFTGARGFWTLTCWRCTWRRIAATMRRFCLRPSMRGRCVGACRMESWLWRMGMMCVWNNLGCGLSFFCGRRGGGGG